MVANHIFDNHGHRIAPIHETLKHHPSLHVQSADGEVPDELVHPDNTDIDIKNMNIDEF